ncbi:hypothetical protein GCM10027168_63580 [Streptomyces capparidis]
MTGRGLFVTLDGPGGAGKTTVAAAMAEQLRAAGVAVHATREPSDTPLGTLARHGTHEYRGMAMACLVAADRHHHLQAEIRPALERGQVVVCDRYLASSLVLQRMDGIDPEVIWQLNRQVDLPGLAVLLTAPPAVLADRLARRGTHSRYERMADSSAIEHHLYAEAARVLTAAGVHVLELDTHTTGPQELARTITTVITDLSTPRPP